MSRNVLHIGVPFIYEWKEKIRLASLIKWEKEEKEYYFEVDKEYGKYLVYENTDAFVCALLYFAMINNYDIECEVPMSTQLYYQLTTYLIPCIAAPDNNLNPISLKAECASIETQISRGYAVGASLSGGVDSFYTVICHLKEKSEFCLTHLFLFNNFGVYGEETDTRKRFKELVDRQAPIANDLGLPLITMYSNMYEWDYPHYQNYFTLRLCSHMLALKKLFGIYYFSSGRTFGEFAIYVPSKSTGAYDLLNVHVLSDKQLVFYTSGAEAYRTEKVACLVDEPIVQKNLQVCNIYTDHNCSLCEKCQQTMAILWVMDKLESFYEVFDVEQFIKDRRKILIKINAKDNVFNKEIIQFMKGKKKLSYLELFSIVWMKYYYNFLNRLKYIKWIRRLYYKLNIDVLRFGKEQAYYYRHEYLGSREE